MAEVISAGAARESRSEPPPATVIIVRDQGVVAHGGAYRRTALRFTAPDGPHAWLNQSQFVSSIAVGSRPGTVVIRVFRVLRLLPSGPRLHSRPRLAGFGRILHYC